MKSLLQEITIFHKEQNGLYTRYNLIASVRNTSILNRNKTGVQNTDKGLIRVFDTKGYNTTWKCQKGDVIVAKKVLDEVIKAPLTEMREKYGTEYVYEVSSIDIFDFNDNDLLELNHIKIGAR